MSALGRVSYLFHMDKFRSHMLLFAPFYTASKGREVYKHVSETVIYLIFFLRGYNISDYCIWRRYYFRLRLTTAKLWQRWAIFRIK